MYGDRKSSILHARFRMGCSSLKYDLFSLNIIDSPKCDCGFPNETCKHYFFDCRLYVREREKLCNNLNNTSWLKRPKAVLISSDHVASPHMTLAAPMIHLASPNLSSKNEVYFFGPNLFTFFTKLFLFLWFWQKKIFGTKLWF